MMEEYASWNNGVLTFATVKSCFSFMVIFTEDICGGMQYFV